MAFVSALDAVLSISLIVLLIFMYILTPLVLSIYLFTRRWMSDRTRVFFAVVLMLDIVGYFIIMFLKI